jgi:hypothetical protein
MQHIDSSLERIQSAAEELPVSEVAPGVAEWGKLVATLVASVERRAALQARLDRLERKAVALAEATERPLAKVLVEASSPAIARLAARMAAPDRPAAKANAVQHLAARIAVARLQAPDRSAPVRRVCSRSRARRRPACRSRSSSDGDPDPGDQPPRPQPAPRLLARALRARDEPFSSREVSQVAQIVQSVCGRELTPARFYAIVHPLVASLSVEQRGHARLLIFLELPDPLQRSFYASVRAGAERENDRRFGGDPA